MLPITIHGLPTMSMGYLLPKSGPGASREDAAVVWRGLMVQKAVQQLLFDVDWRDGGEGPGLDVLVVDMPPGTGDVQLTLGQLVAVDGTLCQFTRLVCFTCKVVSHRCGDCFYSPGCCFDGPCRGISMFRKVSVPVRDVHVTVFPTS